MYEVLELMKDDNYRKRIFTVVLNDANIYDSIGKSEYIKYWKNEYKKLESAIKDMNDNFEKDAAIEYLIYIEKVIDEFIKKHFERLKLNKELSKF